jgi:hypothetical protein
MGSRPCESWACGTPMSRMNDPSAVTRPRDALPPSLSNAALSTKRFPRHAVNLEIRSAALEIAPGGVAVGHRAGITACSIAGCESEVRGDHRYERNLERRLAPGGSCLVDAGGRGRFARSGVDSRRRPDDRCSSSLHARLREVGPPCPRQGQGRGVPRIWERAPRVQRIRGRPLDQPRAGRLQRHPQSPDGAVERAREGQARGQAA